MKLSRLSRDDIWNRLEGDLGMRKPVIAGNWKLNMLIGDAETMVDELVPMVADVTGVDIVVCPPYTALAAVRSRVENSNIALGAQDLYHEKAGAYTGEVAPQMLIDAGCTYTIIGHSERRQYFGETDDSVNLKVRAALAAGLRPMVCVGETLEERESGRMEDVVEREVTRGFAEMTAADMANVVIAYEPIWAIGTGRTAAPEQADEAHALIRELLSKRFGAECSENVIIQYGGSVKPDNVRALMAQPNVDGALVGGASLTASSFAQIVRGAT